MIRKYGRRASNPPRNVHMHIARLRFSRGSKRRREDLNLRVLTEPVHLLDILGVRTSKIPQKVLRRSRYSRLTLTGMPVFLSRPKAEGTGFEPVRDFSQPRFECGALDHSANPPPSYGTKTGDFNHSPTPPDVFRTCS